MWWRWWWGRTSPSARRRRATLTPSAKPVSGWDLRSTGCRWSPSNIRARRSPSRPPTCGPAWMPAMWWPPPRPSGARTGSRVWWCAATDAARAWAIRPPMSPRRCTRRSPPTGSTRPGSPCWVTDPGPGRWCPENGIQPRCRWAPTQPSPDAPARWRRSFWIPPLTCTDSMSRWTLWPASADRRNSPRSTT